MHEVKLVGERAADSIGGIAVEPAAVGNHRDNKNFLLADTPAGASALIYSILESGARANGHNSLHFMTAVLSAMPTRRHSMTSRICCPGGLASTRQRGCTTPNRRRF